MDYKKAKEICEDEIRKAELENNTERVKQLTQELTAIDDAIKEDERLEALANSEAAKNIKLRDILSDYFLKDKSRLNKAFIGRLKETAMREPITVDQYGVYREGLFTFGSYVVEVTYDTDNRLWGLTIFGHKNQSAPVPHHIVEEARMKYIPDYCVMAELYYGRSVPKRGSVSLFEIPGGNNESETDQAESE